MRLLTRLYGIIHVHLENLAALYPQILILSTLSIYEYAIILFLLMYDYYVSTKSLFQQLVDKGQKEIYQFELKTKLPCGS